MKIKINSKLSEFIKSERERHNISARNLSEVLNKGNAFISTIETNKLQTIEFDLLIKLFDYIYAKDSINEKYDKINYALNIIYLNRKNVFAQPIIEHYIFYKRLTPIPDKFIEFVNNSIMKLNSETLKFSNFVNSYSTGLSDYLDTTGKYILGDSICYDEHTFKPFKFNLSNNLLNGVLCKKNKETYLIYLYAIIFIILVVNNNCKIIYDLNEENPYHGLKTEDLDLCKNNALKLLSSFGICTISDIINLNQNFNSLYSNDKDENKQNKLIALLSNLDDEKSTKFLDMFEKNFSFDSEFILSINSLPFYDKFSNLTSEEKQEFILQYNKLVLQFVENNLKKSNLSNNGGYTTLF